LAADDTAAQRDVDALESLWRTQCLNVFLLHYVLRVSGAETRTAARHVARRAMRSSASCRWATCLPPDLASRLRIGPSPCEFRQVAVAYRLFSHAYPSVTLSRARHRGVLVTTAQSLGRLERSSARSPLPAETRNGQHCRRRKGLMRHTAMSCFLSNASTSAQTQERNGPPVAVRNFWRSHLETARHF
jgi:hypothetical protein